MIDELFFELIRVSLGIQGSCSIVLTEDEWRKLYKIAEKQSLVGICFVGLQHLGADVDNGYARIGMSQMQYFTWMGMAARIQHRNEVVNRQCVELQERISADGLRACILKGQGVAALYKVEPIGGWDKSIDTDMSLYRQSGDIDMWIDASKEKVIAWAERYGITSSPGYLHVGCHIFDDTEVELHYRPTYMRSIRHNRRIQAFCEEHNKEYEIKDGLVVPSYEFNVVYLLSHIYRHMFGLGIGLRQLMDYYFTLRSVPEHVNPHNTISTLRNLGLYRFAGAVMFVMREIFLLEEKYLICPVNERRGQMLLEQVMQTGNFGHMDKEQKAFRSTSTGNIMYKIRLWSKMVFLYPEETLSAPMWSVLHHSI